MKEKYKVVATPSDGWWCIAIPSVPGAFSQGRSHQEVIFMARDVISLMLDISIDDIEVEVEYIGSLSPSPANI